MLQAQNHTMNVTGAAVTISKNPGRVCRIFVTAAGSTVGSVSDTDAPGNVGAANLVASIPNTVGLVDLDCPLSVGLTITPGTGQVLTVTYR